MQDMFSSTSKVPTGDPPGEIRDSTYNPDGVTGWDFAVTSYWKGMLFKSLSAIESEKLICIYVNLILVVIVYRNKASLPYLKTQKEKKSLTNIPEANLQDLKNIVFKWIITV